MIYRNSEMKIDQLVNYLNEEKINLSPAFQRGHVWPLKTRRKLVRNIVLAKPIPAIFLYKEAVGSKYTYNILDGKQRLESLILFIADGRTDVCIKNWSKYFFKSVHSKSANFAIEVSDKKQTFSEMSDASIRDFREYAIPTIEISLNEDSSLNEVITLFVDINQQGEPVKRFDIVKAMYKNNALMKGVFGLIAIDQKRNQDVFYKPRNNEFTRVLKQLRVIDNIKEPNAMVDIMWEKLLEIARFVRSGDHTSPATVLKEFITSDRPNQQKLTKGEIDKLRTVFRFLDSLRDDLGKTRIFTDQTHSYTLITSILKSELLSNVDIKEKIMRFAMMIEKPETAPKNLKKTLEKYLASSVRQTTHIIRRKDRDSLFVQMLNEL